MDRGINDIRSAFRWPHQVHAQKSARTPSSLNWDVSRIDSKEVNDDIPSGCSKSSNSSFIDLSSGRSRSQSSPLTYEGMPKVKNTDQPIPGWEDQHLGDDQFFGQALGYIPCYIHWTSLPARALTLGAIGQRNGDFLTRLRWFL